MPMFHAMPTEIVRFYQDGGADAYGHTPEKSVSSGPGNPCRHCLQHIPRGAEMLILAYRPFDEPQPYAETGPIFLCADHCVAPRPSNQVPEILKTSPDYLIKGYSADQRIVYGTGEVVLSNALATSADKILSNPQVAFVDVRSARNNCFQLRIWPE